MRVLKKSFLNQMVLRLFLIEVTSSDLSFGCMNGRDMNDNPVVIILYEYIGCMYLSIVPQKGNIILCKHYHEHVYIPLRLIISEHLALRKLPISNDVLMAYFPLFRK